MKGYTLDAGALIAIDRNDRELWSRLQHALQNKVVIAIPAGALAQAWRDGRTQARLAKFLTSKALVIEALSEDRALAAGYLCGMRATSDVVDASVALCARARGHRVITSDPKDIARLDPKLELIVV